ncbi:MAPEG family protein [Paraburkholderia sp. J67]|uniref:MAPEG family protein n=1 Tax=Paraburkholderia sp. J67 TaxID=2805435 RepID=UPI002ABD2844|nr:MAPEG family protein [Paraburkholderia sp. J67]
MHLTPELYCLVIVTSATGIMWIPYILARIVTNGPLRAMGNPASFSADNPSWAQRSKLAHANAVENLAVFAPLVIVAAMLGISTPATIVAAKVYLIARIIHYFVYTAGIPGIRTLAFIAGFAATAVFATAIFSHVA